MTRRRGKWSRGHGRNRERQTQREKEEQRQGEGEIETQVERRHRQTEKQRLRGRGSQQSHPGSDQGKASGSRGPSSLSGLGSFSGQPALLRRSRRTWFLPIFVNRGMRVPLQPRWRHGMASEPVGPRRCRGSNPSPSLAVLAQASQLPPQPQRLHPYSGMPTMSPDFDLQE